MLSVPDRDTLVLDGFQTSIVEASGVEVSSGVQSYHRNEVSASAWLVEAEDTSLSSFSLQLKVLWCISLYCSLFRKDYEDRLYFKLHSYSLCPFHSEALLVNTLLSILEGNLQCTHPQLEGAL